MTINKVAVIGSGVMGAAIAAHIANSNTEVLLFDIVPDGAEDNNILAKNAIAKFKKTNPKPLTHKNKLKFITPCNLTNDLDKLQDVDWVIEAIIERLDIKQSLYKNIAPHLKDGATVSSNTSTLPLGDLTDGMDSKMVENFGICHFFNPPRYMPLLEVVGNTQNVEEFIDTQLGKTIVRCKDTAGFIANRIGVYWIQTALNYTMDIGIDIGGIDAMMMPMGIPKTGVFGLMDLIGIDLLPLIAASYAETLPKDDKFHAIYRTPKVVEDMIADGYTGRKGKGGFYKLSDKRHKMAKCLESGVYYPTTKQKVIAKNMQHLLDTYPAMWQIWRDTLLYIIEISADIAHSRNDIDEAMKLGYNWKFGPFEMLQKIGVEYFVERLKADGLDVPALLTADEPLLPGVEKDPAKYNLSDMTKGKKPIIENDSARLWDIGDGVACLEFISKMNSLDPLILELIEQSVEEVHHNYKALVIYNDGENFCVGANIGVLMLAAKMKDYRALERVLKQGQDAMMALKYASFPVVAAPSGMALGGGCEVLLHADYVQAHRETYAGLVEVGVGVIPGWGGCKEMVLRHLKKRAESDSMARKFGAWFSFLSPIKTINTMPALKNVVMPISTARVGKSADEVADFTLLNMGITANRARLLSDAKQKALELSEHYKAPERAEPVSLPGKSGRTLFEMGIKNAIKSGQATEYDGIISRKLAYVITGGETDITDHITEEELLRLEREMFIDCLKDKRSIARIEHMLNTGKPLRN